MAEIAVRTARIEDVEQTHEIIAACHVALHGEAQDTIQHLRSAWAHGARFTAWEGARAVGTSAVKDSDVAVFVRPEARRRGIGTHLLQAAERAARVDVLQADAVTLEPAAAPFLRANGYEKAFETWFMGIDLGRGPAEPRWPDGIDVRSFRTEDVAALKELIDVAYAPHPGFQPVPLEEWREAMLGDPSFDASVWFLAEAGEELAGAALNWREGFVKDLVVHPRWRRRGLGEALLTETFRAFRARGVRRVALKTDSLNPTAAWRLYERLGMRTERTYEVFEKRLLRGAA